MLQLTRPVVGFLAVLILCTSAVRSSAAVYNGPGGPLVDDPGEGWGTAEFPITISGTGATVQSVNAVVLTNLTHTWIGDMQLTLLAPDGTLERLASPRDAENSNFNGTYTFIVDPSVPTLDEATEPLGDGDDLPSQSLAIATYGFGPNGPRTTYDVFDNKPLDGTWTLRIEDFGVGDTGALGAWSLDVTVPEPAIGSLGVLALFALRRRR